MVSVEAAVRVLLVSGDAALERELCRRLTGLGYLPLPGGALPPQVPGELAEILLYDLGSAGNAAPVATVARVCRLGTPVVLVAERVDRRLLAVVEAVGAFGCLSRDAADRELLTTLELALQRSRCRRGQEQVLEQAVTALTLVSETRDPFTAGHQECVSRLAEAIAREMGLPETRREGVRLAGLVHDIGKVHVPSEILAKPAALSELERGIVREHCAVGFDILRDVPFSWPVARMVLEHHERLDGSGYPAGLSGRASLLGSRILAVADVVEAMTSHRPYRAALSLEQALAEIRDGAGTRYDPDVARACLTVCSRDGLSVCKAVPASRLR